MNPPEGICLLGTSIYQAGTEFSLSNCMHCKCENSTMYCKLKSCPILKCKREYQEILPGRCCAQCKNIEGEINFEFVDIKNNKDIAFNDIEDKNNHLYMNKDKISIKNYKLQNESRCTYAGKFYKVSIPLNNYIIILFNVLINKKNSNFILFPDINICLY
jgi:hypothetical protein